MIVSTVRCNKQGRCGFLKEDNRVNVMLSRAKHGMFVFGSEETIRQCGPKYARNICTYACCMYL